MIEVIVGLLIAAAAGLTGFGLTLWIRALRRG